MASMYPRMLNIALMPKYQSFFLFGSRSTGKSTLIANYLAKQNSATLVYDFLKSDDFLKYHSQPSLVRQEIEEKIKTIPKESILQVHLDEVQKIPALLDEVHFLIEKYQKKIRFLLSGSSARKLKRGGANLLAGRAWYKKLFPLSLLELLDDFSLNDALRFGTLPPIINKTKEEKVEQLKSYVNTYLKEEIQVEALTRKIDNFHRFLEAAAYCNGELVNLTKIASEASIPRRSVSSYYQILEDTLVGFFLQSWGHRLSRKDLVTHGKFYFFDNGIVNALTQNLTGDLSPKSTVFGKLFESYCILEFMRIHEYKNTEHKIGFFRTRGGLEIDLIEEQHGRIRAIEIKSSESISKDQLRGLRIFAEEFPETKLIFVSRIPRPMHIDGIHCLPYKLFFEEEWSVL